MAYHVSCLSMSFFYHAPVIPISHTEILDLNQASGLRSNTDAKGHTSMIRHLNRGSRSPLAIHLGVSLINLHSPQQLFKTFGTLLKLPNPPLQFPHSRRVLFASYSTGKIEIAEREITQLPVITLTDSHCKCTQPSLLAICLLREASLFWAKLSSPPQTLHSPVSPSPLGAHFVIIPHPLP